MSQIVPFGWDLRSYRKGWGEREILPQPSGQYDSFKNEVKRYITDLIDNMNLGSDLKNVALDFADDIYWMPNRPSTIAGVFVLMAGSIQGIEFNTFLLDIAKQSRKMKYTLLRVYPIIEEKYA